MAPSLFLAEASNARFAWNGDHLIIKSH